MADATRFRVAIVGGGVAGVTALMALADLGERELDVDIICPGQDFVLRPQLIGELWGGTPLRVDLERLAAEFGAQHRRTRLACVRAGGSSVVTTDGVERPYDATLIATGATPGVALPGVLTVSIDELPQTLAGPGGGSVAVVVPPGTGWALPAYQLALLTAATPGRSVRVVTAEQRPLEVFGIVASGTIADFLTGHGVDVELRRHITAGFLATDPLADCVIALPLLHGPQIEGLPAGADGFIHVDEAQRVLGSSSVFAAGDATAGAIKQGGLAAHQAERAATEIVRVAGMSPPHRDEPATLRGKLISGEDELYLRRRLTDAESSMVHDGSSGTADADPGTASATALWQPPAAMLAWRLSRWLASHQRGLSADASGPTARPS